MSAGTAEERDLRPPRARQGQSKRPRYLLNRLRDGLPQTRPAWMRLGGDTLPTSSVSLMWYSLIPGLGHAIDGRARAAVIAIAVWLAILGCVVNFILSPTWWMALSILASWHAQVIFDAGSVGRHAANLTARLRIMAVTFVAISLLYFFADRTVHRAFSMVASRTVIIDSDIDIGDVVFVKDRAYRHHRPERNDIVAFSASEIAEQVFDSGAREYLRGRTGIMLARVIAVGGDRVRIGPHGIRVNGRRLGYGTVPEGCIDRPTEPINIEVPETCVLLPYPVVVVGEPLNIEQYMWRQGYIVPRHRIHGRVDGVVFPLWRWHSFDHMEDQTGG